MLPQAQTMPRRWNKRLPLMWALYVFHMMNMLLHLQRSRGDQSMRVRMRMMKGTREKLTWSHPKSLLNTWPSRPSHPMDTEPAALTLRDVRASDYGFVDYPPLDRQGNFEANACDREAQGHVQGGL